MVFYLQMYSYLLSCRVLKNSKLKVLSSYEKRGLLMYKVCMVVSSTVLYHAYRLPELLY